MISPEFNKSDFVTSFEVANSLLQSIADFSAKCIGNDKARYSYFGFIMRDFEGESWDVQFYKLPKVSTEHASELFNHQTPVPAIHVGSIFCEDTGKVNLDMGSDKNGYDADAHIDVKITTWGQLDKFMKTFHQNYMINVADPLDREFMGRDFNRGKKVVGMTTDIFTKPEKSPT